MKRNGHKFNAVRTEVDGHKFASKAEAKRYAELKMLEKAGEITHLKLQPKFDLHVVGGYVKDVKIPIGRYVADFEYVIPGYRPLTDKYVVEDVKGMKTDLYKWKKKHVEAQYGITITEITR
jgi:hypothetical protein